MVNNTSKKIHILSSIPQHCILKKLLLKKKMLVNYSLRKKQKRKFIHNSPYFSNENEQKKNVVDVVKLRYTVKKKLKVES